MDNFSAVEVFNFFWHLFGNNITEWVAVMLAITVNRIWVRYVGPWYRDNRTNVLVREAVRAIEQIAARPDVQMSGQQKKEWALQYIDSQSKKQGLKFDAYAASTKLEATVQELFGQMDWSVPPTQLSQPTDTLLIPAIINVTATAAPPSPEPRDTQPLK